MSSNNTFWRTPKGWAALFLIGAATYFLLTEHLKHVFQFLPFLIFLMCPLMHIFMHGGHGHGDNHGGCCGKKEDKKTQEDDKTKKDDSSSDQHH